jgi:hypothetical protein
MTTTTRTRVGLPDLLWVAWRRHRTMLVVTTAVVLVAVGWILATAAFSDMSAITRTIPIYLGTTDPIVYAGTLFAVVIAVFWAAPLVAREYEQRTHLVVWGQDITPARWLAGQVVLLGIVVACLSAALGTATNTLVSRMVYHSASPYGYRMFDSEYFEGVPQVQGAHAVFGFALGLACGALLRRTLPAMVLTLFGFVVVRFVLVMWGRSYYLPPVRTFQAWSPPGVEYQRQVAPDARYIDSGYADANHVPMDSPPVCRDAVEFTQCVKDNGVAGHFAYFQPVERVGAFRWIESGIFIALAAALLALTWYWVRRVRAR